MSGEVRWPDSKKPRNSGALKYGAGTRNRTRDLLITSQLLYLLSYTGEGRHYSDWLGRVNLPRREGVMSADAYAQKA